jgi:hypothetical protein
METRQENNIQIEVTDDLAQGVYSNLAVIVHSFSEFILDFVSLLPGMPKAKVKSRIIMTPEHTKRLMLALLDNIKKYEQQHGEIKLHSVGFTPPIMGPVGEA